MCELKVITVSSAFPSVGSRPENEAYFSACEFIVTLLLPSHCPLSLFPVGADKKTVPFLKSGWGSFSRRPSSQRALTWLLQADLAGLCLKAGVKSLSTVFLMTDAQVADEKFLVFINDLLASGKRRFALEYL